MLWCRSQSWCVCAGACLADGMSVESACLASSGRSGHLQTPGASAQSGGHTERTSSRSNSASSAVVCGEKRWASAQVSFCVCHVIILSSHVKSVNLSNICVCVARIRVWSTERYCTRLRPWWFSGVSWWALCCSETLLNSCVRGTTRAPRRSSVSGLNRKPIY